MGRICELCPPAAATPASLFCAADSCYLCAACDTVVHSANRLASRHVRRPLHDPEQDGSSINDESDVALVPDVASFGFAMVEDQAPVTDKDHEVLNLSQNVPTFEDAADYDFCDFDALGGKMPALCGIDDDGLWGDGKLGKSFNGEISWESVVNDGFEHVVPDVGRVDQGKGKALKNQVKSEVRVSSVTSAPVKAVRVEKGDKTAIVKDELVSRSIAHMSDKAHLSRDGKNSSQLEDEEAKRLDLRKKRRMEALARFRSKRANRSFTKRVRYECRKQLADSRPRVKGRFVRKIEMALFRKYGALYREHLDELKDQSSEEHCVPSL